MPWFRKDGPRERLAAAQAALLAAMLDGTRPPAGFDPEAVAAAAAVLDRKRSSKRKPRP